jgi:hypothetical protein
MMTECDWGVVPRSDTRSHLGSALRKRAWSALLCGNGLLEDVLPFEINFLSFQKPPPKASCAYYVEGVHMEGLNLDNLNNA